MILENSSQNSEFAMHMQKFSHLESEFFDQTQQISPELVGSKFCHIGIARTAAVLCCSASLRSALHRSITTLISHDDLTALGIAHGGCALFQLSTPKLRYLPFISEHLFICGLGPRIRPDMIGVVE